MCGAGKVEYSPWGVHVQWCVQETWASVRLQEVTADWLSSEWEHTQHAGGRRITNLSQLGTRSQIKSLSAFQRERVVLVVRESLECRGDVVREWDGLMRPSGELDHGWRSLLQSYQVSTELQSIPAQVRTLRVRPGDRSSSSAWSAMGITGRTPALTTPTCGSTGRWRLVLETSKL